MMKEIETKYVSPFTAIRILNTIPKSVTGIKYLKVGNSEIRVIECNDIPPNQVIIVDNKTDKIIIMEI